MNISSDCDYKKNVIHSIVLYDSSADIMYTGIQTCISHIYDIIMPEGGRERGNRLCNEKQQQRFLYTPELLQDQCSDLVHEVERTALDIVASRVRKQQRRERLGVSVELVGVASPGWTCSNSSFSIL